MRAARRNLVLLLAGILLCTVAAFGQDSTPSLGEVARQARLQKQQQQQQQQKEAQAAAQSAKDGQSKDGETTAGPATPSTTTPAPGGAAQGADAQGNASAKDAQPAKGPKHVITNDEIPEHIGPTSTYPPSSQPPADSEPAVYPATKASAEQWKAGILNLKNNISSVQESMGQLAASIQYAGANCVANCAQWNERQKQKQDQVDAMKQQLEQMQKSLEDMQDAARKQGYGTAVYDP